MSREAAHELTAAVLATAGAFLRESQRLFRPLGLTAAQYNVLNLLAPRDEGLSQRELSDLLVVDRSNVTGLIDRMEGAGWVQRKDDPSDRRVYRIVLTAEGRRLFRRAEPRYQKVVAQVTRRLTGRQMTEATRLLRALEAAAVRWEFPET